MKMMRGVLLVALLCGCGLRAKADDFQMIVVDPNPLPNDGYIVHPVNGLTISFTFSICEQGEVPGDSNGTYVGCWTGQNDTQSKFTSLTITVPNNIPGQTAGCGPSGISDPSSGAPIDLFSNPTCGPNPIGVGYILNFTGTGGIAAGQIFTIAEQGVDPDSLSEFGTMTGVASAAATVTPEPGTLWLLSTGLLSSGSLIAARRRKSPVAPQA